MKKNTTRTLLSVIVIFTIFLLPGCMQPISLTSLEGEVHQSNRAQLLSRTKRSVILENVPFFPQTQYQCGPAALATIANYYHHSKTPMEIGKNVFLPERKGSLQVELVAELRSMGLLPYPLAPQLEDILDEVESGSPILVLQNLGSESIPFWHYAVVVGFDLDKGIMLLNSGKKEHLETSLSRFMTTWQRSGYWAIAAVPAGQIPVTANRRMYLKTASDMEELGHLEWAGRAYDSAIQQWPDSILALIGLSNVAYQEGDFQKSKRLLLQALRQSPEDADILNNLAYTYAQTRCFSHAVSLIDRAISLRPNLERYLDSKEEIIDMREISPQSVCE